MVITIENQSTTQLNIVNEHLKFPKVTLVPPSDTSYLLLAAEVDKTPLPFFIGKSRSKRTLLENCKNWCKEIEQENGVDSAVVFEARLIPPGRGKFVEQRPGKVHIARFDVVILIEVDTQETLAHIQSLPAFQDMKAALENTASFTHCVTANNVRRIGAVDHERQGIFLFNFFFADSTEQNLAVWEYTAGWFQAETNLDNSTVLLPYQPENTWYSIINHCRWDRLVDIVPSLLFKPTFTGYVLENFEANQVAAIPILYKLA